MRPGDLLVSTVELEIFIHNSPFRSIVNQGIIDATGAAAVIHRSQFEALKIPSQFYNCIPKGSCLMYVSKSDINFVHVSQPKTPVHFLFYNGLSCVMIASDNLIERSFRVISHI